MNVTYANIAEVYYREVDPVNAEKYFHKALAIDKDVDKNNLLTSLIETKMVLDK